MEEVETEAEVFPRVIPREYLNTDEAVLFETRPAFMAVVGLSLITWMILGTIMFGIAIEFFSSLGAGVAAAFLFIIYLFLVLLPIILQVLSWKRKFFALTDHRILQGGGIYGRGFTAFDISRTAGVIDISTYRITGVTFSQGFTGRLFNYGNIIFKTNRDFIYWKGIKDPLNVRRNVEEKVGGLQNSQYTSNTFNEEMVRRTAQIRTDQAFGYLEQKEPSTPLPNSGGNRKQGQLQGQSVFCNSCGYRNVLGSVFCSKCGGQLPTQL